LFELLPSGRFRVTYEKKAMTMFAQAALAASELITTKFAQTRFSGSVIRVVNVEAPKVESTQGGKQARESIVLKPENGDVAGAITCGFLDIGIRACELRSYASLSMLHRQRFNAPLDLHQSEYEKFMKELVALLEGEGFAIKIIEPEEQQAKANAAGNVPARSGGSGGNVGLMVGIGVVAALVVVGVVVMFLFK
jgi:hypothetical protein